MTGEVESSEHCDHRNRPVSHAHKKSPFENNQTSSALMHLALPEIQADGAELASPMARL